MKLYIASIYYPANDNGYVTIIVQAPDKRTAVRLIREELSDTGLPFDPRRDVQLLSSDLTCADVIFSDLTNGM